MTEGHEDYLGDLWDLLPTDPTDFIEDTPTEDEAEKTPSSEWAFDHNADVNRHHTKFTIAEHDLAARHGLAVLDPLVCSEAEAAALIIGAFQNPPVEDNAEKAATSEWCYDHWKDVSAHHIKFTAANARTAINDIFGADGKADSDIDFDGNDILGEPAIVIRDDTSYAGLYVKNDDGHFFMGNSTGTANAFAPVLDMVLKNQTKAAYVIAHIPAADDAGVVPVMIYRSRRVTNAKVVIRPIFQWQNYTILIMTISAAGVVKIHNLAGVGNRAVIADANGNLSAP